MLEATAICSRLRKLTFDLESDVLVTSRATWATSVPILVFLGLSVLDLCPMYATDRQTSDVRQTDLTRASLHNAPYPRGGDITVIANGMLHTSGIVNSAGNSAQVLC